MSIQETLERIGLASEQTTKLFHKGTRDNPNIDVYRDQNSGVIYIKDFYVGEQEYESGEYRKEIAARAGKNTQYRDYERANDCARRVESLRQFYTGKKIADFGCGYGDFLYETKDYTGDAVGIELQENCVRGLKERGIRSFKSLDSIPNKSIDTFFLFHSFEHLPEPLSILSEIREKLSGSGKIVIEVPHANDFLISILGQDSFIDFTLWSQHLILHTRASLKSFLEHSGYKNVSIKGIQRYPISNHIYWMSKNKPGGHRSNLSLLETPDLNEAYAAALSAADATDTLLAIADNHDFSA